MNKNKCIQPYKKERFDCGVKVRGRVMIGLWIEI
jgi:hypothetical protein